MSAHEVAADDALQVLARMVRRIDKAGDRVTRTLIGVAVPGGDRQFCEPGSRG